MCKISIIISKWALFFSKVTPLPHKLYLPLLYASEKKRISSGKKCISNPLLKKKFPLFIAHYAQSGNLFVDQSEWSIVCGILREKHRVYSGWCWLIQTHLKLNNAPWKITSFLSSFRLYFFLHVDAQSDEDENNGSRVCLHGSTLDSKFPEIFQWNIKKKGEKK